MDADKIRQLLQNLQTGEIDLDQALAGLRSLPYEETEFARLDTHRSLRTGLPEVVFCEHKTPEQAAAHLAGNVAASRPGVGNACCRRHGGIHRPEICRRPATIQLRG